MAVGSAVRSELVSGARTANVVICVLDGARADRVGYSGYPRDTTPNMDELAAESVVFTNHFSTCSLTRPSTASLFTGLYPDAHCIDQREALEEGTFTLAKGLKAAGLRTALFSSNVSASPETGVGSAFEHVFPKPGGRGGVGMGGHGGRWWRTPESLAREFAKWLEDEPSRFFAYVHFLPPHMPYEAPDAFAEAAREVKAPAMRPGRFEFREVEDTYRGSAFATPPHPPEEWADLYDANLRWADWGLGEVVGLLREHGLLDNTLLVVTSDHGEAFGEHGYVNHMHAVYDEFVHIPLLIRFPGRQGLVGEVDALTQTVDLVPTVCDLYGIGYPRGAVQGESLLPLLDGTKGAVREHVFAVSHGAWPSYLVRDARWSLILYRGGKLKALYDLRSDPEQRRNVIAEHPETAARMTDALISFGRTQERSPAEFVSPEAAAEAAPRAPPGRFSEDVERELRDLGYLR